MIKLLRRLIELYQKLLKLKKAEFNEFALVIRLRESSGNYRIVNSLGFLGAYQFGMARLCDLGLTKRINGTSGYANKNFEWKDGYSKEIFLVSHRLQDKTFRAHVKDLIKQIKRSVSDGIIKEYTLSGLVAGAHLGGIGGVKKFLEGKDREDAYGTSVGDYIKRFKGYNIE